MKERSKSNSSLIVKEIFIKNKTQRPETVIALQVNVLLFLEEKSIQFRKKKCNPLRNKYRLFVGDWCAVARSPFAVLATLLFSLLKPVSSCILFRVFRTILKIRHIQDAIFYIPLHICQILVVKDVCEMANMFIQQVVSTGLFFLSKVLIYAFCLKSYHDYFF